MRKTTPTLTQSGLLAVLLQRQRYKVFQLARRRAHRKDLRAAFWSTLTWPWRARTAPALIDVSAKPLWTRDVISQSPPFLFTLAAIMAALGILFGLWFGVSTYHALRPSYPYYDTQKPVPPWSEPTPLEGNHDR